MRRCLAGVVGWIAAVAWSVPGRPHRGGGSAGRAAGRYGAVSASCIGCHNDRLKPPACCSITWT
jgi:hypothetical protein